MTIWDVFAGARGWEVGAARLGFRGIKALEFWGSANATARAAGFAVDGDVDVAAVDLRPFRGSAWGLIGSPPCQPWSKAGKGLGLLDQENVLRLVDTFSMIPEADPHTFADWHDPKSHLAAQPMRYVAELRPEWVALEEVPAVLPLWRFMEPILQEMGYATWVGTLHAEQYGAPQTRQRAVLLANRTGHQPTHPRPTHSRFYARTISKRDPGVRPWVSMREALGVAEGSLVTVQKGYNSPYYLQRSVEHPSYSLVGGSGSWKRHDGTPLTTMKVSNQSGTVFDLDAQMDLPVNTLAGRNLLPFRGTVRSRFNSSTQSRNDGWYLTPAQAAVLQTFPAEYPWRGNKTDTFLQIGNAVPPLMAAAALQEVTGL